MIFTNTLQRIFVKQIFTHQATQNQQTYKHRHIRFKAMKETRSTYTLPSFLVSFVYQQPFLPPCCASLKFPTILLEFQEHKLLVFQRICSDFAIIFHAPHSLISTYKQCFDKANKIWVHAGTHSNGVTVVSLQTIATLVLQFEYLSQTT